MRLLKLLFLLVVLQGQVSFAGELADRVLAFSSPPVEFADKLGNYRPLLQHADGKPLKSADEWQARRQEIKKFWHETMGPWPKLLDSPRIEVLEVRSAGTFCNNISV